MSSKKQPPKDEVTEGRPVNKIKRTPNPLETLALTEVKKYPQADLEQYWSVLPPTRSNHPTTK